ncbi:MAG TPA: hypothetical protein PKK78_21940 [Kouleothrix sp.]|nr:hypothetical protein [Kouleothrix sp.]
MPGRYPLVIFAPNGGATFSVRLDESQILGPLRTPMPATQADGRLAPPWRWGGHQVDRHTQLVHFTFVNRLTNETWQADVPFGHPAE